jgi:protein O-GlcNAc transferase
MFWKFNDFGYVKRRKSEMKIYCKGSTENDSTLECTDHLRMCKAKNILIDFKNLKAETSKNRYRSDVLNSGDIGGYCELDINSFKKQSNIKKI